jgi:hypothetical protein
MFLGLNSVRKPLSSLGELCTGHEGLLAVSRRWYHDKDFSILKVWQSGPIGSLLP